MAKKSMETYNNCNIIIPGNDNWKTQKTLLLKIIHESRQEYFSLAASQSTTYTLYKDLNPH